jgi:hypothetical protein
MLPSTPELLRDILREAEFRKRAFVRSIEVQPAEEDPQAAWVRCVEA